MKFLIRKLIRTVLKNWIQFFSVFLMAFLSVLFYTGLEGTWNGMKQSINEYSKQTNLADSSLQSTNLSHLDIKKIEKIKNVKKVSAKFQINSTSNLNGNKNYIHISTPGNGNISKIFQENGEPINKNSKGIYVNQKFADSNHLHKNKILKINIAGKKVKLKINGLINSSDKMYYTGSNDFISPQTKKYGYAVISEKTLSNILHIPTVYNTLDIKNTHNQYVEHKIRNIIGNHYIGIQNRKSNEGISTAVNRVSQIQKLSIMFSIIFVLLSVLAMYTTIRKIIDNQKMDMATLSALGYKNSTLSIYYSFYGLIIGVIGSIVGLLVSPILSNFVLNSQKPMFSLPNWQISYTSVPIFVSLSVIIICTFSAYLASRINNGLTPAQSFTTGNNDNKAEHTFIEKFSMLWDKIPFGNRWSIRDNNSNKIQMIMGLIGIIGGLALVITGFGTKDSMYNQVKNSYGLDYAYANKINLNQGTSYLSAKDINSKVNGQEISNLYTSISDKSKFDYPLMIVGNGKNINIKTFDNRRISNGGIYVSDKIAQNEKIKTNQKISIMPSFNKRNIKLKVAGIIKSSAPQSLYITKKTWEKEKMKFMPTSILTRYHNIPKDIKNNHYVSQIVSLKEQRNNADAMVNNLSSIFLMIQIFGILLTVVILYNLGSLSFTERSRSYATLEILGFSRSQIRNLTIIENSTITIIGLIIGLPFGYWFLSKYVTTFNTDQIIYYPSLSIISLLLSLCIVIVSSFSTVILIGRRLNKLDMISSTKGVE